MNFRNQTEENQNQNFSGGMQEAQTAFRGGRPKQQPTEPKYKYLLTILWALPVILFMFFLGVDYDQSFGDMIPNVSGVVIGGNHWATVLIFFSWVIVSQTITYFLIKKYDKINPDMYLYGFSVLGFMAGFYLIPQFHWFNRFWVSFLTMMFGSMIGKGSMMLMVLWKGMKQFKLAQKQMAEFQAQANPGAARPQPKTKEALKQEKAERMAAMMKREQEALDQMLREQGIDIDALDEEFGTTLDGAFEKADAIQVNDFVVEEEVVEVIDENKAQH